MAEGGLVDGSMDRCKCSWMATWPSGRIVGRVNGGEGGFQGGWMQMNYGCAITAKIFCFIKYKCVIPICDVCFSYTDIVIL